MKMDALSRVIDVLRLKPTIFHRLELAQPWGMRLAAKNHVAFHVVEEGTCWLYLADERTPLCLHPGDLIVISNTSEYALVSHEGQRTHPINKLLALRNKDGIISLAEHTSGTKTSLLCGNFESEFDALYPLFSVLPRLLYIQGDNGKAVDWLKTPIEQIGFEVRNGYPGKDTVISRIMDILFIMVIRYWVVHQAHEESSLFSALYHPQIGDVLTQMHQHPEFDWTVERLAEQVNMSRSSLAMKFTALVGESPMKYLTRWRMQLATTWLIHHPDLTIEQIAQRTGYSSAYAFSKAFKRLLKLPPSDFRRRYLPDLHGTETA